VIRIQIAFEAAAHPENEDRLRQAVQSILEDAGIRQGSISIAIVDDPTIHDVNRRFLDHDFPTDVISFVLEEGEGYLEGEIVASIDTAARTAASLDWSADDELLLYVIHGALHLVGYDDLNLESLPQMRQREREYLSRFGLNRRATDGEEL
jgi:probable rRNA maturation factor